MPRYTEWSDPFLHCKLQPNVPPVLPLCHLSCPSLNCAWDLLRAPGWAGGGKQACLHQARGARTLDHAIWHSRGPGTQKSPPPVLGAAVILLPGFQRNCWGQGGHIYGQDPHGPAEDDVQGSCRLSGLRPMCVIGSAGRKIKTSPSRPSPPPEATTNIPAPQRTLPFTHSPLIL